MKQKSFTKHTLKLTTESFELKSLNVPEAEIGSQLMGTRIQ